MESRSLREIIIRRSRRRKKERKKERSRNKMVSCSFTLLLA
jgi:hypothetical protein